VKILLQVFGALTHPLLIGVGWVQDFAQTGLTLQSPFKMFSLLQIHCGRNRPFALSE